MIESRRLQLVYPGFAFRAGINYKNVAKDKPWAEGSLFCDGELNYYIVEKEPDECCYEMHSIFPHQIWTDTLYRSGSGHDIFESDILKLTGFRLEQGYEDDGLDANIVTHTDECSHPIYISPPLSASTLWSISGVVCFMEQMPCIYYFSSETGSFCAAPLANYFEPTGFPPENMAAEVLGNTVDNPDIVEKIFRQGL